jgi:CheY-like chemotaxis protein
MLHVNAPVASFPAGAFSAQSNILIPVVGAPRILLADDNDDIRRAVERELRKVSLDVVICPGGPEALSEFHRSLSGSCDSLPFDLVVLDYKMPVMDGREVALRIRQHEEAAGRQPVPLAFFTGYFDALSDTGALAFATAGVLTKPTDLYQFGHRLLQILGGPEEPSLMRRSTDVLTGYGVVR